MPAVPGVRLRDPVATRQLWVERLERFGRGNQTVAQFCAAEGVSVPSFYVWKRTLAGRTTPPDPVPRPTLVPIRLTPSPAALPIEVVFPSGTVLRFPPDARQSLIDCLWPGVYEQIARTHPDRQRFALAQADAGRDPLGKPPDGIDPPYDTLGVGEILSRLARNIGALDRVADGLLGTPLDRWPEADNLASKLGHATAARRLAGRMAPRVLAAGTVPGQPRPPRRGRARGRAPARRRFDPASALRTVAAVAGVAAKNDRDLDRALAETPPTASEKADLLDRLRALRAAADRLAAVVRSLGHDVRTGPAEVPGTYVVVYHLTRELRRLRIGALGTFDFPAGYYAYVGSAFGGGGVGRRIGRHLTRRSNKRWNIDHLKPHCTPVAVWWTHDRRHVEFNWADALARMPGASFPAARFGAADNDSAQAHLVRFRVQPSASAFRRRASRLVPGQARVHDLAVDGWGGQGRPRALRRRAPDRKDAAVAS